MTQIKIRADLLDAFVSCVQLGAEGLDETGDDVLTVLEAGQSPLEGPDVDYAVFEASDGTFEDLKACFTVGWEGLDTDDGMYEQSEEVAKLLGVSAATPAP